MKYFIEVWGCQMNEHDAETLGGLIEKKGFTKADNYNDAQLIVLHTCCIRAKAEDKVIGRIGALSKLKKKRPEMIIAVGGCMTQQEEVAKYIEKRFDKVDIIYGTHNLNEFDNLLSSAMENKSQIKSISNADEMDIREYIPITRNDKLKAFVNIIYGCNNYCSYCIVPYVRGREKSREVSFIVEEVKDLLDKGFKDITLLGQNVNSYGKDFKDNTNFSMLLKELDKLGDYRLRFMSSHPRDFDLELVDTIKNTKNVCHQIHLPLQSGSDRIIKEMNRGYTKEHYLALTEYIYKVMPEATISTDIIVGFPGETEDDFLDTMDVVENVGYDQAYMFMYSIREGTRAAKMENQVPEETKKERFHRLLELQKKKSLERNSEMQGKIYEVLVEGLGEKNRLTGRTRGNKVINFKGDISLEGELVKVKVTDYNTWSLYGELIGE